jgi:hypothetical protein
MPRKKLTEKEIDDIHEAGRKHQAWAFRHPWEAWREHVAQAAELEEKQRAHVKKHKPVVTDITYNGDYVRVAFVRNNGERVIGEYKRCGWAWAPATVWRRMSGAARFVRTEPEPGSGTPPPVPDKTPLP